MNIIPAWRKDIETEISRTELTLDTPDGKKIPFAAVHLVALLRSFLKTKQAEANELFGSHIRALKTKQDAIEGTLLAALNNGAKVDPGPSTLRLGWKTKNKSWSSAAVEEVLNRLRWTNPGIPPFEFVEALAVEEGWIGGQTQELEVVEVRTAEPRIIVPAPVPMLRFGRLQ